MKDIGIHVGSPKRWCEGMLNTLQLTVRGNRNNGIAGGRGAESNILAIGQKHVIRHDILGGTVYGVDANSARLSRVFREKIER